MGICRVNKLVVGNKNTEKGSIQIYGKDIDVLKLGDATHEGGDVSIYRDSSGNKQVSIDADAAQNAKAVDIYGGVVIQKYLTLGQAALDTNRTFTCIGNGKVTGILLADELRITSLIRTILDNASLIRLSIPVIGTDSTNHAVKLQIDENDIFAIQATGDGAGGITNKAIGFFGVTPQVQQNHIIDADGNLADITTKFNTLLADLEGYGLLKAS